MPGASRLDPPARFVLGDFKIPDWSKFVEPPFDAVVAMQAVHEVRHKQHLPRLYASIIELLRPGGLFVVCDHEPPNETERMTALHSTEAEQHAALDVAHFESVATNARLQGMYICSGRRPETPA